MADFYVVSVDRDERGEITNVGLESPLDQRVSPFPAPLEALRPLIGPQHRFFVRRPAQPAAREIPVPVEADGDIQSFARLLSGQAASLPCHRDL